MQYSNEIKVGAAIILAVIAAVMGVRFLQDIPLWGDSYTVEAEFEEAGGLTAGNPVRMRGVNIGSVESVRLNQETQNVHTRLRIEGDIKIPRGSHAKVSGFSGFGGVRISIIPGPGDNPPLTAGATLTNPPEGTVLERLTDQAPELAALADSVLANTNSTMSAVSDQFQNPDSDLRATLQSIRSMANDLESVTETEKENIRALIGNLEAVSGDLREFTGENGESLDQAVARLNESLDRLNQSLVSFEKTSASLDTITTRLKEGHGTAGRLLNDPGLYTKLDSAAARTNEILRDFEENPGRYLDDMTLMRVF